MAHLTGKPVGDEASTVGIPFVAVVCAYPLGIRVAVLTNENDARSVALVVAAVVMFHVFIP
jgi:ribosomal protein S2